MKIPVQTAIPRQERDWLPSLTVIRVGIKSWAERMSLFSHFVQPLPYPHTVFPLQKYSLYRLSFVFNWCSNCNYQGVYTTNSIKRHAIWGSDHWYGKKDIKWGSPWQWWILFLWKSLAIPTRIAEIAYFEGTAYLSPCISKSKFHRVLQVWKPVLAIPLYTRQSYKTLKG